MVRIIARERCNAEQSGSKGWNAPGVTSTDLDPDQDTHAHVCAAEQMGWRNVPDQGDKLGGRVCKWCGVGVVLCGHDMAEDSGRSAGGASTKRGPSVL